MSLEEFRNFLFIVFESRETMQRAAFEEQSQTEMTNKLLKVDTVDVFSSYLINLSSSLRLPADDFVCQL